MYQNKCVFWLPFVAKSSFYIERDCYKEGKLWQEASILWCPSRMNYIIGTLRNNGKGKGKNDSATISNAQLFWVVTWNHCEELFNTILFRFQHSETRIVEISESNILTKLNVSSFNLDIFCLNILSALKT